MLFLKFGNIVVMINNTNMSVMLANEYSSSGQQQI